MKKEHYYNKTLEELYGYFSKRETNLDKLGRKEFLLMIPFVCLAPMPIGVSSILIYWLYVLKTLYGVIDYQMKYVDFYLNSVEYKNLEMVYKFVLEELSLLFEQMGFDNEMKIYAGYYYMLRNGYLSVNKSFYYRNEVELVKYLKGANIMDGYGNCSNISSMLTDLLRENNYEAYNIGMFLPDDAKFSIFNYDFIQDEQVKLEKLMNLQDIDGLYKVLDNLFSILNIKKTNHLITLFRNDIHSYGIDPTNNTIFGVDAKLGCLVEGDSSYYVRYDKYDNINQKNRLVKLLKTTSSEVIDEKIRDYYKVYDCCSNCTDIFEKFYREHKYLYEEVNFKRKILVSEYLKNKPY